MKTLNTYTEQAISDLLATHGAFFAFSNDQFNEKKQPDVKYVNCGSGLICPKANVTELLAGIQDVGKKGKEQDISENGIEAIIERELRNHEAFYTGDIEDTVDALVGYGITAEQVMGVYRKLRDTVEI